MVSITLLDMMLAEHRCVTEKGALEQDVALGHGGGYQAHRAVSTLHTREC